MAIIGDDKHDSGNEVTLDKVNGQYVSSNSLKPITLDKVKVKLLAGMTRQGNLLVELVEGFERDDTEGCGEYNAALDGIESLILAHASNGIDVASEAYQDGVQTALDAIANNL
jgi:hypothetical protein